MSVFNEIARKQSLVIGVSFGQGKRSCCHEQRKRTRIRKRDAPFGCGLPGEPAEILSRTTQYFNRGLTRPNNFPPSLGLPCQHQILKVSRAQPSLKLIDDGLYLSGSLMRTGNIKGLARMPIFEMR